LAQTGKFSKHQIGSQRLYPVCQIAMLGNLLSVARHDGLNEPLDVASDVASRSKTKVAILGGIQQLRRSWSNSRFHGKVLPQWNFHFHGKGRPVYLCVSNGSVALVSIYGNFGSLTDLFYSGFIYLLVGSLISGAAGPR